MVTAQLDWLSPGRAASGLLRVDWSSLLDWQALLPRLLQSGIVVVLAFFAYRIVILLTRRLERDIVEEDPLVKRAREQRARTIASLLNNSALVVIMVGAGLTVLSTVFDIDIAPLLTGLGVFGLAISFGAQSLVKDVISGAFILIEGQFGIGDVIRVGDVAGMVERITLRTTVLRDIEGAVHILPNGEINRVSNLTKAWSRAVLDVPVSLREDVDRVMEVLRGIGAELYADPEWRPLLLEHPEVLGIQRFTTHTADIRMIAKTLPLKQWDVARELRRRILHRFAEEGIAIPFPHVTVYWGTGQKPFADASGSEAAPAPGRGQDELRDQVTQTRG